MYCGTYPYLSDTGYGTEAAYNKNVFLSKLDTSVNQKRYVRIKLLDWQEQPIREIQGDIVTGSISKDGGSSVRRTATLSTQVSPNSYDINSLQMDYSVNKKIFLEVGIKNTTNMWSDYPILWFPQGVFFIKQASISSNADSVVALNLQLVDKMAMLNGLVGGMFPAPVILDSRNGVNEETGSEISEKVRIIDIIQELVHHYGNEPLNNIVIEDVPKRIKQKSSWCGDTPLYQTVLNTEHNSIDNPNYIYYLNDPNTIDPDNHIEVNTIQPYESAGYVITDFVYPGELTMNAGMTVTHALDSIKELLGNYEYYYDVYGVFHFNEIKNYLNTTFTTSVENSMKAKDYLFTRIPSETEYSFKNGENLMQISRSPQFENIKNDYVISGTQTLKGSSIKRPLTYHLVVDRKPNISKFNNIIFYKDPVDKLVKAFCVKGRDSLARPNTDSPTATMPLPHRLYVEKIKDKDTFKYQGYFWINGGWRESEIISLRYIDNFYKPQHWQTQLYLDAICSQYGEYSNAYAAELKALWPGTCHFKLGYSVVNNVKEEVIEEEIQDLHSASYYLDFLDTASAFGQYSVNNIGRRTIVSQNKKVNCLVEKQPSLCCFISTEDKDIENLKEECVKKFGLPWTQVPVSIYNHLTTAGFESGALNELKYQLYLHTSYQNSLSLSVVPNFWLEPNTCVTIEDTTTNTYGSYMVKSISLPLDVGSSMSVNCIENTSRTY